MKPYLYVEQRSDYMISRAVKENSLDPLNLVVNYLKFHDEHPCAPAAFREITV